MLILRINNLNNPIIIKFYTINNNLKRGVGKPLCKMSVCEGRGNFPPHIMPICVSEFVFVDSWVFFFLFYGTVENASSSIPKLMW